jgi:amidase
MTTVTEDDVAYAGVEGQAALLRAGNLTSQQLVELLLGRIARLDARVNAFRTVLAASARAEAAAADEARARGDDRPLLGVPIAVKDTTDVAGVPTLHGTGSPEPSAGADAEIVRLLRAAGMVIIGKTNLPELALWGITETRSHGITRNPWALDRTPGGSSGGSAAAVAAGFVPAAHGSDGLGSIRIPASACGLVGLKPTRGLVPMDPDPNHWDGLSHAGFLTRSVRDTALLIEAVTGRRLADLPEPGTLRIGATLRAPLPTRVHPEVRAAHSTATRMLADLGHSVSDVRPGYGGSDVFAALVRSWLTGANSDLSGLADPSFCEPRTRRLAAVGGLTRPLVPRARRVGERTERRVASLMDGLDVLVLPSSATPAPRAGAILGRGLVPTMLANAAFGPFTGVFNVTGHPAVSVPVAMTSDGVPLGVQLVGRHGDESTLLGLAAQLERATGWLERRPTLS